MQEKEQNLNTSPSDCKVHILYTKFLFKIINFEHLFKTWVTRLEDIVLNIIWQYLKRFLRQNFLGFLGVSMFSLRSNTQTIVFALFLWNYVFSYPAKHTSFIKFLLII